MEDTKSGVPQSVDRYLEFEQKEQTQPMVPQNNRGFFRDRDKENRDCMSGA